jgi:alkylation response protein AidB-like acyl-CoA dehydrogenase
MNFDFSEEQKLLQQTARDYLAEHSPLSVCRHVLETDGMSYSETLWAGAAELGWLGTAIPEEYGGAGFGHLELALVAEEVGRALAPIPFSSSVYVFSEAILDAGSERQREELLPKLTAGRAIGTYAFSEKPGHNDVEGVVATFEGGLLNGVKLPVPDGDIADYALVASRSGGALALVVVDLNGDGVTREALQSIDPSRSLSRITFSNAVAEPLGSGGDASALAARILDRAAALMAFEQLGAATHAFEITREFTLDRYAFGRPIASFQAIKHRLADLWCEIELARSNCYYAAWALANDAPELGVASASARISASEAFHLATVEMIQMHGGVGYTWEYDCHLFYRRAQLLSAALGSPSAWRDRLIERVTSAA